MLEFLRARLPKNCQIHGISASGVVGEQSFIVCVKTLSNLHHWSRTGVVIFVRAIEWQALGHISRWQQNRQGQSSKVTLKYLVRNGRADWCPAGA